MPRTSPEYSRENYVLKGKRSLGQNFLVDRSVIERIIEAFDPKAEDVVLEIGPGYGALTERLVDKVGKLSALEFDRSLARMLREKFNSRSTFTLIEDDALHIDFTNLVSGSEKLKLIANLPYNISTAILQRLFEVPNLFSECLLMFQKEVVDRIAAPAGTRDRGYLTVMTSAYFSVERLFDVAPGAFQPTPKIWSSVVRLTPVSSPPAHPDSFRHLVGISFAQKRKTILNNLKTQVPNADKLLIASQIDPKRRAESLQLEEWERLVDAFVTINSATG